MLKTLECDCGGGMVVVIPQAETGIMITHKCNSCGYITKVRGQVFPEVKRWDVEIKGLTDHEKRKRESQNRWL